MYLTFLCNFRAFFNQIAMQSWYSFNLLAPLTYLFKGAIATLSWVQSSQNDSAKLNDEFKGAMEDFGKIKEQVANYVIEK